MKVLRSQKYFYLIDLIDLGFSN